MQYDVFRGHIWYIVIAKNTAIAYLRSCDYGMFLRKISSLINVNIAFANRIQYTIQGRKGSKTPEKAALTLLRARRVKLLVSVRKVEYRAFKSYLSVCVSVWK